jgi:hypothetical protein
MNKDEALDLALEALERLHYEQYTHQGEKAITAIKQALAAQPEPNGWAISYDGKTPYAIWPEGDGPLLDLEVKRQGGTCCKLPIYTAAPVQPVLKDNSNYRYDPPVAEPVGLIARLTNPEQHYEFTDPKKANAVLMSLCQEAADALAAPVPPAWFPAVENILNEYGLQAIDFVADFKAAMKDAEQLQRQWVGLSQDELDAMFSNTIKGKKLVNWVARAIEAKLKEKNT